MQSSARAPSSGRSCQRRRVKSGQLSRKGRPDGRPLTFPYYGYCREMKRKIRVAILFGGKSAEHEVSVKSAKNVADAMDKTKYDVSLFGIDRAGHWLPPQKSAALLGASSVPSSETGIALAPGENGEIMGADDLRGQRIDVVFPILHRPFGEDGTVQGLLRLANVPFVGAGVLGSAVAMDKDVTKRLLRDAGLPIPNFFFATKKNSKKRCGRLCASTQKFSSKNSSRGGRSSVPCSATKSRGLPFPEK